MFLTIFSRRLERAKPGGRIDTKLYPELQTQEQTGWLGIQGSEWSTLPSSSLALVALLPFLLVIAVAVKLSSHGPVLFRQDRVGQFGKRFMFLKFRSMRPRTESTIHQQYVRKLISGELGVPKNGVFKIRERSACHVRWSNLRKTSLDELPQFWNVLIGEMSLVGPRPPLPYEVEVYDIWHRRRVLEAKPGITGFVAGNRQKPHLLRRYGPAGSAIYAILFSVVGLEDPAADSACRAGR